MNTLILDFLNSYADNPNPQYAVMLKEAHMLQLVHLVEADDLHRHLLLDQLDIPFARRHGADPAAREGNLGGRAELEHHRCV